MIFNGSHYPDQIEAQNELQFCLTKGVKLSKVHIKILEKELSSDNRYFLEKEQQRVLLSAHGDTAKCLCSPENPELSLVKRSKNKIYLRTKSGSGLAHENDCPFKMEYFESFKDSENKPAIREDSKGNVHISLSIAVGDSNFSTGEQISSVKNSSSGHCVSRARWGLYPLFSFLYETKAHLTSFHKRKPPLDFSSLSGTLYQSFKNVFVSKEPLSRKLWISGTKFPDQYSQNKIKESIFLVLGEIPYMSEEKNFLFDIPGIGTLAESRPGLFEKAIRRRRQLFSVCRSSQGKALVFARVRYPWETENFKSGTLVVLDIEIIPTSRDYIPVDSLPEAYVAALVNQNRHFQKPLRMDYEAHEYPDFKLKDCSPWYYLEIFGMEGFSEYEDRKRKKIEVYKKNGTPLWSWNGVGEIQPFPIIEINNI